MKNESLTIKSNGTHEIEIKKSRFICTMARIENEDQAKNIIAKVSKDNAKANHNCFAYMLGDDDHIQRESDNGEPSGTAGVPILEVLKMNQLHNVLAVVTRYFSGIKLGAGGLIRAYSNATSTTIDSLGIVKLVNKQEIKLTIEYNQFDKLKYFLEQASIPIEATNYTDKIEVVIAVSKQDFEPLITQITNLLSDQFSYKKGEWKMFEVPYSREARQKDEDN
ncbi:YigZ family protein [Lentilactobacillus kefiri]|uniref:YigZ family protein n=1 Tax=Lentilactobacillus kefiri TaxID=33962 RepID=A0A511DVC8_LENKE|nr:YigZ family protein [Lentilactobacillus kefiri]MCJ2162189.1 YigZ family protein [Lentilactobacillus kefiri]MCP9369317.1 YigZ family protein [Lentilactobacillus kefiri]MDH5109062.1 YigZ family protein [Lentilactobacillus kefiri]MDM7493268.1 YigZ family protein [Lentilactobacillus kefiri]PAK59213.1 YigZ family protein [Lentilactobacillus kefiri]